MARAALMTAARICALRNPPSVRNYMLGNWDSRRSRLENKGVAFDLYYISDFLGNPSGGRDQIMTDWGSVRCIVDIDLGTLSGAHAPTFHVTGVWQYGTDLGNRYLGTIANPSSLVSTQALRL